ncbi:MAG: hypothetical protein IKL07_01970 [Clostridium sp.]|nr:hypothetical protein [Clostridium sp.]
MKKISIYIDIDYKGNFACGEGKISIVLEMMHGDVPVTKEHFWGYKETTKNRISLLACINALSYMKEGCEITIYIDSAYVTGSVPFLDKWQQEGLESKKNSDLWKKYIAAAENHLIEFVNEKENEYSRAMAVQRNIEKIIMLTDYKPEDEFK